MSMAKRRTRLLRRTREWRDEHLPMCVNCGEEGKHYVPASLGESGFFICEHPVSVSGSTPNPQETRTDG